MNLTRKPRRIGPGGLPTMYVHKFTALHRSYPAKHGKNEVSVKFHTCYPSVKTEGRAERIPDTMQLACHACDFNLCPEAC